MVEVGTGAETKGCWIVMDARSWECLAHFGCVSVIGKEEIRKMARQEGESETSRRKKAQAAVGVSAPSPGPRFSGLLGRYIVGRANLGGGYVVGYVVVASVLGDMMPLAAETSGRRRLVS